MNKNHVNLVDPNLTYCSVVETEQHNVKESVINKVSSITSSYQGGGQVKPHFHQNFHNHSPIFMFFHRILSPVHRMAELQTHRRR